MYDVCMYESIIKNSKWNLTCKAIIPVRQFATEIIFHFIKDRISEQSGFYTTLFVHDNNNQPVGYVPLLQSCQPVADFLLRRSSVTFHILTEKYHEWQFDFIWNNWLRTQSPQSQYNRPAKTWLSDQLNCRPSGSIMKIIKWTSKIILSNNKK